jgi:hypothetical protein
VKALTRNTMLMLALGAGLTAAVLAAWLWYKGAGREDARSAVPYDAQAVLHVDLARVRLSPYAETLAYSNDDACETEIAHHVQTLALWVDHGRWLLSGTSVPWDGFGIAARANVDEQAVLDCAQTVMRARGASPTFRHEQGFRVIVDETLGPDAAQVAVRNPGLLLLAPPRAQARMVDTVTGKIPSSRDDGPHARMQQHVGQGDLAVSVVLDTQRRDIVASWLGEPAIADSVQSVAVAANLNATTEVHAMVWCDADAACEAAAQRLNTLRDNAGRSIALRAAGVASLLEAMQVHHRGSTVSVRFSLPAEQVLDMIKRFNTDDRAH